MKYAVAGLSSFLTIITIISYTPVINKASKIAQPLHIYHEEGNCSVCRNAG